MNLVAVLVDDDVEIMMAVVHLSTEFLRDYLKIML